MYGGDLGFHSHVAGRSGIPNSSSCQPRSSVILRCTSCESLEPVRLDPSGTGPCPSCGSILRTDTPLPLRGQDFRASVLSAPVPVLVDFHAEWCGPCKWIVPTLEEVARAKAGELLVVKVDTDEAPELAEEYRITSVPTVVLFQDGKEMDRSRGVEPHRVKQMAGMERSGVGPGGTETDPPGGLP
jgi:thioredoxin 2